MINSMFLVEHNVPDVYVNESRDFQLVSRLYDLALQSTRFSIDSMDYISDTQQCNDKLLDLIGSKVGFFSNLSVPDDTLRNVLTAFPYIMRHKGSKYAIQLILNLFMHITNSRVELEETDDPSIINIVFYDYMLHVQLLQQLIEYIRPTGVMITYEFKTYVESVNRIVLTTDVVTLSPVMNYVDTNEETPSGVVVSVKSPGTVSEEYNSDVANTVGFTVLSQVNDKEYNLEEQPDA